LLAFWQNGLPDVEVVARIALGEATTHNVIPQILAKIDWGIWGVTPALSAPTEGELLIP
jgi:hypothetical protein